MNYKDAIAPMLLLATVVGIAVFGIDAIGYIHEWEVENDFPYGKLCDLYRNCR
jgi:hypothetical protein